MKPSRRAGVTALVLTGMIAGMLGLTAASVPLYRMFCQATGYGGTTQRAAAAPGARSKTIKVNFNADVAEGMPWSFTPESGEIEIPIGEEHLAFYRARNNGTKPITGTATFNVTPDKVGYYFTKIACFCFTEQTLQPGESADMPVSFFIDPEILDDPDAQDVRSITLSYTFFPSGDQDAFPSGDQDAGGAAAAQPSS